MSLGALLDTWKRFCNLAGIPSEPAELTLVAELAELPLEKMPVLFALEVRD
jgi:hypothetical protein